MGILSQSREAAVTGLGHDGALGDAGGGGQAGRLPV